MSIRSYFSSIEPHFEKGGKFQKYYPIFEMIETIFFTSNTVTKAAPHARSFVDMKRIMTYVVISTIPCVLWALYNTGFQTNSALSSLNIKEISGWRIHLLQLTGLGIDPTSLVSNVSHGLLYFLPIYITTLVAGGLCEVIFATVRGHEVNEGFLVSSMLFALTLPASTPLWQVALGIAFGVVVAKEVFGGTGKNFLNPALTGRAFLYFAYPLTWSGDSVWVALDGFTAPTLLAIGAQEGTQGIESTYSWSEAFLGSIPGSVGETSTLFILFGLLILLYTRIASWRIILGVLAGTAFMSGIFNLVGSDTNPMFDVPFYWHIVIGGYAFGLAFMAVEPVSGSHTNLGRWYYGILIGIMVVLIRVVNPAFPEGMMLAILFANLFAPIIDHFIQESNIKKRKRAIQ